MMGYAPSTVTTGGGTTAVQVWTLIVAGIAVLATLISAYLLRRTGKGTVEAARQAARAAEQSAQTAIAALVESFTTGANEVVQEFFLRELEQKRDDVRTRISHLSSIKYQLGVLMTTCDRKAWTKDIGDLSPTGLVLPTITVDAVHSELMAMALVEILTSISALSAMFEVAKLNGDAEACWKVLGLLKQQCRLGREVAEKSLSGHYSSEGRITSEMHTTRNAIVGWRHRRQSALQEYLGMPELELPEVQESTSDDSRETER